MEQCFAELHCHPPIRLSLLPHPLTNNCYLMRVLRLAVHFNNSRIRSCLVKSLYSCPSMTQKSPFHQRYNAKRQKKSVKLGKEGSNEEVLLFDVKTILQNITDNVPDDGSRSTGDSAEPPLKDEALPERFSEIQVRIAELSSTGDGIGKVVSGAQDHLYAVPFTVPGDLVKAKVITHFPEAHYSLADFVSVIEPGPQRDDSLVKCPYFAKCGGCQIQMLPYEQQLEHKKGIIEKAYRNFSSLIPEAVPAVADTMGSPLQYGYRTKLTPHFDGPPGSMSRKNRRERKGFESVPPIGFMMKGQRKTIDIEECPIGTDAVRDGMKKERARVIRDISSYFKGATLLLRESTLRVPKEQVKAIADEDKTAKSPSPEWVTDGATPSKVAQENAAKDVTGHVTKMSESEDFVGVKTCITDQKGTSTEYVDDFVFKNTAGSFFQNNNSILSPFTAYIRDRIMPPRTTANAKPLTYLIDAYCGSGLFTVTLSSLFQYSMGIDISEASISAAKTNASANNVKNASFLAADAARLFDQVSFPAEKTAVVIDPSKKGCDEDFIRQLLRFGPQRIAYVSCNVHTQARDVGVLVEGKGGARYMIESLRGFDFFPQTGQVESVAILNKAE